MFGFIISVRLLCAPVRLVGEVLRSGATAGDHAQGRAPDQGDVGGRSGVVGDGPSHANGVSDQLGVEPVPDAVREAVFTRKLYLE